VAHERRRAIHQQGDPAARVRYQAGGGGSAMSMGMTSAPPVAVKDVRSWRLLAMMTGAGAIAGALIVTAYQLTLPKIEHHQGEVEQAAVNEVLKSPARLDTLYLVGDKLVKSAPTAGASRPVE